MSTPDVPWAVLGIEPTADNSSIRRAYAAKLKVTRPEDDRAGFERLRAAYEFALRWAGMQATTAASPPMTSRNPQPPALEPTAPPPVEEPQVIDPELDNLHRAFAELHGLLRSNNGNSPEAVRALERILQSPALDNISIEQRVQHQLAALLASSIPASDSLLKRANARFRWSLEATQLDLMPQIQMILNRLDDVDALEALSSGKSAYSRAFRGLQRRKIPLISWMMHFTKAGAPGEYQLLQLIRLHHPSLLPLLEPSAVEWWDKHVSRPRVSFPILLVGALIVGLEALIITSEDDLKAGLISAAELTGGFIALALWKLYLLDWPRHLMRTKLPVPPMPLLVGWLPASIAIVLLAMIPAPDFVTWVLAVLAFCVIQWAWIVGWTGDSGKRQYVIQIPLIRVLTYNIVAIIWWLSTLDKLPPVPQLHLPIACAMASSILGLPIAALTWEQRLTSRQRWLWLFATSGMAIIAAACFWLPADHERWIPLAAVLAMAALLMHRHVAATLGRRQQELRFGWMVTCFVGLIVIAARAEPMIPQLDLVIRGFSSLILSTVLLCMLMAMWNERRGRIAPYRDDPIHEALYW